MTVLCMCHVHLPFPTRWLGGKSLPLADVPKNMKEKLTRFKSQDLLDINLSPLS